jgi:uncharacterized protein YxeA
VIAEILALVVDLAFLVIVVMIVSKSIKNHKEKKAEEEAYNRKKAEYDRFDHSSGQSWSYQDARAYQNAGNEFKESDFK